MIASVPVTAQEQTPEPEFPIAAELFFAGDFRGCEGIGVNGEGRLFVTANKAL